MRYLIAIILAILAAAAASMFVSVPVASWVVRQFTFDSPDSVADLHMLVFMAMNIVALLAGWAIGWAIGGAFDKDDPVA
ncbi:MAG: hypothetical protein ACK5KM_02060 [Hyphomicrobiaceae bacterium]